MSSTPGTPPDVMRKYQEMKEKNLLILTEFQDLPKTERVIQNYRCTYKPNNQGGVAGKLYLAHRFALFISFDGTQKLRVPYAEINLVRQVTGFWPFNSSLIIDSEISSFFFTTFFGNHRMEAYQLLKYLVCFTPVFHQVIAPSSPYVVQTPSSRKKPGKWGDLSPNQAMIAEALNSDIDLVDQCVNLVDDIFSEPDPASPKRKSQELPMNEKLEGQFKSLFTSDSIDENLHPKPFRPVSSTLLAPVYDVPILVKHSNDDLEPAILRFGPEEFACWSLPEDAHKESAVLRNYQYRYSQINLVVVRVRPQHVDIRFHDGTDRFRCLSSFVQMITNEVVLRTRGIKVQFEYGARMFDYGEPNLRQHKICVPNKDDLLPYANIPRLS